MEVYVRQIQIQSCTNGYVLNYGQQTGQVRTQDVRVGNTLGQIEGHVDELDNIHEAEVKALKAKADKPQLVEAANG